MNKGKYGSLGLPGVSKSSGTGVLGGSLFLMAASITWHACSMEL